MQIEDYSKLKIKKGYIQEVVCATCKTSRKIHRRQGTPANYSFYCMKCRKEVAQRVE